MVLGADLVAWRGSRGNCVGDRWESTILWPRTCEVRTLLPGVRFDYLIGNSFTFGVGLSDEDTYVTKLQRKIDAVFGAGRIALLNVGIGGSGTAEHLAFIEDFGNDIAPRAILVFVSIDDFNRAVRSPLYRLRDAYSLDLDEGSVPTRGLEACGQFRNLQFCHSAPARCATHPPGNYRFNLEIERGFCHRSARRPKINPSKFYGSAALGARPV